MTLRQQVWTRYWAGGASHSCGTSYGEHYGGAIAAFWRGILEETPPGARLLDVATGSGAIPRLWHRWRNEDAWDAVDLANQAPPWAASAAPWLRFHAAVRAESLPFEPHSFDLVTSQYGLEYCDLARAVPEVLRVRAPAGRVALVLHHSASRPVLLARAELAHIDWALGQAGLIGACADMLVPAAEARTPEGRRRLAQDPNGEAIRLRFNAAQVALRERATTSDGADALHEIRDAVGAIIRVAMTQGEPRARSAMASWMQTLTDHRWRLDELCSHALDDAAVQALAAQISAAGLQCALGTLVEGPHVMGWTLRAAAP